MITMKPYTPQYKISRYSKQWVSLPWSVLESHKSVEHLCLLLTAEKRMEGLYPETCTFCRQHPVCAHQLKAEMAQRNLPTKLNHPTTPESQSCKDITTN